MKPLTIQTVKRRAARAGIRPDDLDDAAQFALLGILEEQAEPHHYNSVIQRRLIDFARREYGTFEPDGRSKRRRWNRRAHGLGDAADYDERVSAEDGGERIFHHLNATADHADAVAARVDVHELIRRADVRLSPSMFRVLIADTQGKRPADVAHMLGCTVGRVFQIRTRAYEILRSVA